MCHSEPKARNLGVARGRDPLYVFFLVFWQSSSRR
jgi:hypothetical protein